MPSGILLLFKAVSERDSDYTTFKEYVVITAIFCVCVYVYSIYMNKTRNSVNTYRMAGFPWKMLLRGLEFDLIRPYATSH